MLVESLPLGGFRKCPSPRLPPGAFTSRNSRQTFVPANCIALAKKSSCKSVPSRSLQLSWNTPGN